MSIKIEPIRQSVISVGITGTSPFISHAWSEKGLRQLRMTAAERKKQPKVARSPEDEALQAAYYTDDGEFGIPAMALKSAIITAAHKDFGVPRVTVQKALFIERVGSQNIIPLQIDGKPKIREDIVRVGINSTDMRYRCEFFPWSCEVGFVIDESVLNEKDVLTLIERAGFAIGVGEWRPERGGEFGRFEVNTAVAVSKERKAA